MFRRLIPTLVMVALPASTAFGQLVFFDNEADFVAFNAANSTILDGLETFEENNLGPGGVAGLGTTLEPGVPNGPFENGLTDVDDMFLSFQNPAGVPSLGVLLTDGFFGAVSSIVGPDTFGETTTIHMLEDDKVGIGFYSQIPSIGGGNGLLDVLIYDTAGVLLEATVAVAGGEGLQEFFGVWSPVPIGSINVAGQQDGGELLDNISMWVVPAPASLSLFALGAATMLRRRR